MVPEDVSVLWTFETLAQWRCLRNRALQINIYLLAYLSANEGMARLS